MEANSLVVRHWDDVVFENRNKAYGAYLLRRAYVQRLMSGLGVTVGIIAFLLTLPNILGNDEKPSKVLPPAKDGGTIFSKPPVLNRAKPKVRERQPRTNVENRPVLVTREAVEQTALPELEHDFSDETGIDTGLPGDVEGAENFGTIESAPVSPPKIRDHAEVMPAYEGGNEAMMKFIQKKIRFPRSPQRQQISGTVFVRFIVNGDGSVSDVEVIKGVHPDYDKEAMRVISMLPSWKGGRHNGMPVRVRMVLPIKFNVKQ
jgi:protein TonB